MRCREFEDRMNDVLDQRLLPERDALLLHHVSECHSCRQLLDSQAALFAGLELLDTPPLPNQFAAIVLEISSAIPGAVPSAQPRRKSTWLAIAAGLASLAAVVLVTVLIDMSSQQPPLAHPSALKPASPNSAPKTMEVVKNSLPQEDARTSVAKAVAPPRVEIPVPDKEEYKEYRAAIDSFTAQFPSAVEKIDEVQQSTPAIRPLRASFSMAIGTLQRTIPNRNRRDTRPIKPDSGFSGHPRDVVV